MAENNSVIKNLQNFFGIGVNKNAKDNINAVFPTEEVIKNDKKDYAKVKFNDDIKALYDWWLNTTHEDHNSWKSREDLWQDMTILYDNCPYIARAVELTADEIIQADGNDQIIFIDAKAKVKKAFYEFADTVNLNSLIRPTAVDLVQFGNCPWIIGFDDSGVSDVVPKDVNCLKDRLEFTPNEVRNKMQNGDKFFRNYSAQSNRVDQLIQSVAAKENYTSYFKTYLLGFIVEDMIIPPWGCIHFRNTTYKSPFAPFGVPMYIHAMSPYRQYDAAMTLQQAARASMFPKHMWKLNLPNVIKPTEKVQKALELLAELQNAGINTSKKEIPGVGDTIVTIEDLVSYEEVSAEIDLGKMDDIELLNDAIIVSTFLPRYLIDPNDSGFGDSGVALVEQWKPFARLVYRFQSILLQNISQLFKIHMIASNQFTIDEMDFTLSMKYPESQTNSDIISSQNSLIDLANNIIGAIQDKITGGEPIPPEVVKDIYTQFFPFDTKKVEKWVDDTLKSLPKESTFEDDDTFMERVQNSSKKTWKLLEKEIGRQNLKEKVEDIMFEEKQKVIREMSYGGRHVYSSRNVYTDFPAEQIRTFDKNIINKLQENEESDLINKKLVEDMNYVFTYNYEDEIKKNKRKLKEKKKKK